MPVPQEKEELAGPELADRRSGGDRRDNMPKWRTLTGCDRRLCPGRRFEDWLALSSRKSAA